MAFQVSNNSLQNPLIENQENMSGSNQCQGEEETVQRLICVLGCQTHLVYGSVFILIKQPNTEIKRSN